MKKLINYTLILGSVIALASCSAEDPTIAKNDDGKVTLTVQLPSQNKTRFNDGQKIDQLYYSILDKDGTQVLDSGMYPWEGKESQQVTLDLVPGQEYQVVFFADSKAAESNGYTYTESAASLSITYDDVQINDDIYDAFYKIVPGITTKTSSTTPIVLTRPFAQINIGTKGLNSSIVAPCIEKYTTEFTLAATNLADGVSFLNGKPSYTAATKGFTKTVTDLTATKALALTDKYPVPGFDYLDMMYLLVNPDDNADEGKAVLSGSFNVTITDDNNPTPVADIPLLSLPAKENYQTNIYGSLLTDATDLTISINPGFGEGSPFTYLGVPDTAVAYTDAEGNVVNGLYVDSNAKTLYTGTPEALNYLNKNWYTVFNNPNQPYYSIKLYSDIDFTGYTWIGINSNSDNCRFNGIDGQGCTIRNFTTEAGTRGGAMFWGPGASNLPGGGNYIRNLNLENVTVNSQNSYHAAIFVCQTYGNWEISNVHVNKATINGCYDVATFVGRVYNDNNEGRNLTMTNVSAKDVTIIAKASKLQGGRYDDNVGCVVGFVDEGQGCTATFTNVTVDGLNITAPQGFTVVTNGYQYSTNTSLSAWEINTDAGISTSNVTVTYTEL